MNPTTRRQLLRQSLVRVLGALIVFPVLLLLPAGTWRYWQAWVFVGAVFVPMLIALAYMVRKAPELLERRLRTREERSAQRRVIRLAAILYLLVFLVPGLDRRLGWSHVPLGVTIAADVLLVLAYGFVIYAMLANRYASRVVEVAAGQQVVTTGPYAWVRHPMYLGASVMLLLTPLSLGSWWALLAAVPIVLVFAVRALDEERLLEQSLPGYREYEQATRYRLLPGVW